MTARACAPAPPWDCWIETRLAGALPATRAAKAASTSCIQLAGGVVGDVEQLDRAIASQVRASRCPFQRPRTCGQKGGG